MKKSLNKFYDIIDKIGKQNLILIVFIILVVAITGIVQTFSLYTELSGTTLVDNIKTYQFILNANNTTNTVTIPANESKNVDITVSNESNTKLLYGIYYTSNNIDAQIGYLSRTSHLPNSSLEANSANVVTVRINNNSSNNATITFGVKYGFENGGDLTLETGQSWIEEYREVPAPQKLNTVELGSYVAYTGNNGCSGDYCKGNAASIYTEGDNLGCTQSSGYNLWDSLDNNKKNGWRVAYIEDDTVHLVSASYPECACYSYSYLSYNFTNNSGLCGYNGYISGSDITSFDSFNDNVAKKYCNSTYSYNGVCNDTSVWSLSLEEVQKMSLEDLSQISGNYWLKLEKSSGHGYFDASNSNIYYMDSYNRLSGIRSNFILGVRPVIRLASTVYVTGGSGTQSDPYTIGND